jgi:hypothetical protein
MLSKKTTTCYLSLVTFLLIFHSSAKPQKIVDVNLLTGAAQVSVPAGSVQAGDINFPLVFQYNGGGVKVEDYGTRYGIGWSFTAEASVIREVRGFPDDVEYVGGTGYSTIKGWLRNTGTGTAVENFSIANGTPSCAHEVDDYSYMNSYLPDNYDTEPDIYTVNVPGLGFQFVFDKNQQIKVMPYRDVKVEYATDGTSGLITSFTITNDKGIKYVFDQAYWEYHHIDTVLSPSSLPAFKRDYVFYRHDAYGGWVGYNSQWFLSNIYDTRGNRIGFSYEMSEGDFAQQGSNDVRLIKYNPSTTNYDTLKLYKNLTTHTVPRVKAIHSYNAGLVASIIPDVSFGYLSPNAKASLGSMQFGLSGITVGCILAGPFNKDNDQSKPGRYFMTSIEWSSRNCSEIRKTYRFTYDGVTPDPNPSLARSYCWNIDSITNAQDYWGYFNGNVTNLSLIPPIWVYSANSSVDKYKIVQIPGYSGTDEVPLPGSDRSVNSNAIKGSLTRIDYPDGGVTIIDYENKDYLDPDLSTAVLGGGIRVSKIAHNDGLNTNDVTTYDYDDPSTSVTTGRATAIPSFTFAFPNNTSYSTVTDKVKNSTYRTLYDHSGERTEVLYGKVTVTKEHGGKSVYEFNIPGMHRNSSSGDWSEVTSYVSRQITSVPSPCPSILPDFLTNGKNNYPFSPNPNIDYERGLLNKVSNYNETGDLIEERSYTYQSSHSSTTKISALKYDDVGSVRAYAKYDILTIQDKLIASKSSKTYNASSPTSGVYTLESENYYYPTGSVDFRLPIKITKGNSDGNLYVTEMKYAKDYAAANTGSDDRQKAIYFLNTLHHNALIETYQYIDQSSDIYIGGSLTTFKKYSIGDGPTDVYLPYESYKFASSTGTLSFTPSFIDGSHNFVMDGNYKKLGTILEYDFGGRPALMTDNSRLTKGALWCLAQDLKVAELSNAKPAEVNYIPFDYYPEHTFTFTSGNIVQSGRYSDYCYSLTTSDAIYGTIDKAATNKDILYSCWVKRPSGSNVSGNLTIALSASGFSASYNISFTATDIWKYYELIMPKPSPSTITVTVSTDAGVLIDDILVQPSNSTIKTNSYSHSTRVHGGNVFNLGYQLTAETGMHGMAKYYVYTNNVMPYLIKDQDENIIQRNLPRVAGQDWGINTLEFDGYHPITWDQAVQATVPTTIYANLMINLPCEAALSYLWDFGDGTSTATTTVSSVQHTYATAGVYQVSCTVSATGYTSVTGYSPVTTDPSALTVYGAPTPTICAHGIVEYTSSAQCVQDFCASFTHQAVCTETKFGVTSVVGASISDIANWKWEKAPIASSTWTTVVDGVYPVLTVSFSTSVPETASYKVRCTVTLNNGLTATSSVYNIVNNH